MAREDDFKTRMVGDTALLAILTGGVYTSGTVGMLGITRESVPAAFDANGWLKPCALVRQRTLVPTTAVVDYDAQLVSASQIVEIYFYQDTGYVQIDAAMGRTYALFQGYRFGDTFELRLANVIDRQRDLGPLNGASLARQEWQVPSVIGD